MVIVRYFTTDNKMVSVYREDIFAADQFLYRELKGRAVKSHRIIDQKVPPRTLGIIYYGVSFDNPFPNILGMAMEVETDFPEQEKK